MSRVAVIGDIGGHPDELYAAIVGLGAGNDWDDTGILPADLTVIQLGDLIDRGPDSPRVLAIVQQALDASPGQWIQLAGNHEARFLGGPQFEAERQNPSDVGTLWKWRMSGTLRLAAGIRTSNGRHVLVTHAGLGKRLWGELGSPPMPDAVDILNELWARDPEALFEYGTMLADGRWGPINNPMAGPLWIEPATELYPGWLTHPTKLPFDQIHGHASAYTWHNNRWRSSANVTQRCRVNRSARHVTFTHPAGGRIHGIDPCFGKYAGLRWAPKLYHDATIVVGDEMPFAPHRP